MGTDGSVDARHLLISNPPHGSVDAAGATSYFGLTAAEVGMKANYGLPEIWFAADDEATLLETAASLKTAGLNTVLIEGRELVEIPGQNPVESFAFADDGLRVDHDDSETTLAYGTPVTAVFGRPQVDVQAARSPTGSVVTRLSRWGRGFRRPGPDASLVELGASPFLDLYVPSDTGVLRISIVQELTDFSQLSENLPHGLSGMQNLVAECENRFEKVYVDRRLVDMTLRGIARVVTEAPRPGPVRTGFSFATQALAELLSSLSPTLKDLPQADLSSRLAYLTSRSEVS